jgi:hypothetical protein
MVFITIVRIGPPKIDCPLLIDGLMLDTIAIMRIIIIFVTIDITEMIIVVVRAHDLAFNKPYDMRKFIRENIIIIPAIK